MEQSVAEGHNVSIGSRDILTEILRQGAQEMLAIAIDNEVGEYIARHAHLRDGQGHRLVVRNGHLPARTIQTGLGNVEVHQPRVNDKRMDERGQRIRFSSRILPPHLRRSTGSTCVRPIRLNRRSRRCVCGRHEPRAVAAARPA